MKAIRKSELIKRCPLGQVLDTDIAKKVGCSREYVRQIRRQQGIERPTREGHPSHCKTPPAVIEKIREIAGTAPDAEIAKALGVKTQIVAFYRRRFGIAAQMFDLPWKQDAMPMLGVMSDEKVARKFNVALATVQRLRKKHGIAAWRQVSRRHE